MESVLFNKDLLNYMCAYLNCLDRLMLRLTCQYFKNNIKQSKIVIRKAEYAKMSLILFKYLMTFETFVELVPKLPLVNLSILEYSLDSDVDSIKPANVFEGDASIECVKYLHSKGYSFSAVAYTAAALYGNMEVIKYLHKHNYKWDGSACVNALRAGNLEVFKYVHEYCNVDDKGCNCDNDENACNFVIQNGDMDSLKHLHEIGCPWNRWACVYAAKKGHLEILKYLHQNNCPWDAYACTFAAQNGHLDILKYLHENGCPWDYEEVYKFANEGRHEAILKYLNQNK